MSDLKRLRAETDRYVAIDAKALDCDPEEDALAHALAAERAHADAEIATLRSELEQVKRERGEARGPGRWWWLKPGGEHGRCEATTVDGTRCKMPKPCYRHAREAPEKARETPSPATRTGDCAACPHPGSAHLDFSGLCTADGCPCIEHEPRGGGDA